MAENNMFSWIPALQQFAQFNMQVAEHMETIKKKREEEEKQATGMQVVSDMAKNLQSTEFTSEEDMVKGYGQMLNTLYATKNPYAIQQGIQVLPGVFEMKKSILKDQKTRQGYAAYDILQGRNVPQVDIDLKTPKVQLGTGSELVNILMQSDEYKTLSAVNPELASKYITKTLDEATYKTKGIFANAGNTMNYSKIGGTANDPNSIEVVKNKQYKLSMQGIQDATTGKIVTDYAKEFGEDAPDAQKAWEDWLGTQAKKAAINNAYARTSIRKPVTFTYKDEKGNIQKNKVGVYDPMTEQFYERGSNVPLKGEISEMDFSPNQPVFNQGAFTTRLQRDIFNTYQTDPILQKSPLANDALGRNVKMITKDAMEARMQALALKTSGYGAKDNGVELTTDEGYELNFLKTKLQEFNQAAMQDIILNQYGDKYGIPGLTDIPTSVIQQ